MSSLEQNRSGSSSSSDRRKGIWSHEEDELLRKCIEKYGEGNWHLVPLRAGLSRCRKSCRLRWLNYLKPGIKRGNFAHDEIDLILRLHRLLGNRWALIAGRIPGRTANDIKNFWNTHMSKKYGVKPKASADNNDGEDNLTAQRVETKVGKGNRLKGGNATTMTQPTHLPSVNFPIIKPQPLNLSRRCHIPKSLTRGPSELDQSVASQTSDGDLWWNSILFEDDDQFGGHQEDCFGEQSDKEKRGEDVADGRRGEKGGEGWSLDPENLWKLITQ